MNLRSTNPRTLATRLCDRSPCRIQVAAVLSDRKGRIFAWGWNHPGRGLGQHAEAHAISRANPRRLKGATITVMGQRPSKGRSVLSRPCDACMALINRAGIKTISYYDPKRGWTDEYR